MIMFPYSFCLGIMQLAKLSFMYLVDRLIHYFIFVQGVPGNGELSTTDELVQIVTCIIYTCSISHASTNFPQYEEYAFPPNYPSLLRGTPPTSKVSSKGVLCFILYLRFKYMETFNLYAIEPRSPIVTMLFYEANGQ